MGKNIIWLLIGGAVLYCAFIKKDSDPKTPSYDALEETIKNLRK